MGDIEFAHPAKKRALRSTQSPERKKRGTRILYESVIPDLANQKSCTLLCGGRPTVRGSLAPARCPDGTQGLPLTVATFRSWRGSQVLAAPDPAFNAALPRRAIHPLLGKELYPAIADFGSLLIEFEVPLIPRLARLSGSLAKWWSLSRLDKRKSYTRNALSNNSCKVSCPAKMLS